MANPIVPQVDIGALSLQGLQAVVPLLAALSADNVQPAAMLQLQALGGCFLSSGKYAAKVPDCLRRCTSVRVDRLALSVGWRKGDAASYMADSAGGQSVSLLALCLFNVFKEDHAAGILHDLSAKLLPRDASIASVSQLLAVGRILGFKLDTLGFLNLLAQQVTRVHDAYKQLGEAMPKAFFEDLSTELTAELLACISQALREEKTLVRITGSSGMAHILGITLMMFPQDTSVTVENIVISEGLRKSIVVDIGGDDACHFQLENIVGSSPQSLISRAPPERDCFREGQFPPFDKPSFTRKNWLADFLQIKFLEVGLSCPPQVLLACCNLLVLLPEKIELFGGWPPKGSLPFLGGQPQLRMRDCCRSVFGMTPVGPRLDIASAFSDLATAMNDATSPLSLNCKEHGCCNFSGGWPQRSQKPTVGFRDCERRRLWNCIGDVLEAGFLCFFVNAGPNTTFCCPAESTEYATGCVERELKLRRDPNPYGRSNMTFWDSILDTFCARNRSPTPETLAQGSRSCIILPSVLRTFQIPQDLSLSFDLFEGQFLMDGRYYDKLTAETGVQRQRMVNSAFRKGHLVPSNDGAYSDLLLTARDRVGHIGVRATVRVAGAETSLSLFYAVLGSWLVLKTMPCDHPMSTPLESELEDRVETTSVGNPQATIRKVGIVQTLHNDVARFLSCRFFTNGRQFQTVLLSDCCLSCAVRQAIGRSIWIIIV